MSDLTREKLLSTIVHVIVIVLISVSLSGCSKYWWSHRPPVPDEQTQSDHAACKAQRMTNALGIAAVRPTTVGDVNELEAAYQACMEARGYQLERITIGEEIIWQRNPGREMQTP